MVGVLSVLNIMHEICCVNTMEGALSVLNIMHEIC